MCDLKCTNRCRVLVTTFVALHESRSCFQAADPSEAKELVYAEFDWNAKPQAAPKPDVIRGADDMTVYADIDFQKSLRA